LNRSALAAKSGRPEVLGRALHIARNNAGGLRWLLETEDQCECFVYGSELIGVETPGGSPQALRVDNRGLLDQDAGLGVVQ
jgi:hypothetical protein